MNSDISPNELTKINSKEKPQLYSRSNEIIRDWNHRVHLSRIEASEKLNLVYSDSFKTQVPVTSIFSKYYVILRSNTGENSPMTPELGPKKPKKLPPKKYDEYDLFDDENDDFEIIEDDT